MPKTGVMICGHGSRDPEAIAEFESAARGLRERLPQYETEYGFLAQSERILAVNGPHLPGQLVVGPRLGNSIHDLLALARRQS